MKEKISVNIYPTRTIIRDIPESYEKSIQKSLSVWNKVTFSYSFYAYKEELNEEDEDEATYNLIVPSGYNLKRIIASLSNSTLSKVIVNDYRLDYLNEEKTRKKKFKKVTNFSEPKDDIQKRTLNYLNNNHHSNKGCQKFVALKTGKGKTFCAIKYITDNNERPIIFVDQDSLGKQWIEKIREYTNTTSREIYFISGKPSIDKLMKMSDEDILNIKFFVCCYRTISNILKNDEIELFKLLFEKLNVTVKVYDEAHIEYMSMVNIDLNTDFKSLYLSATPHRTDPIEDKVYQNIFHDVDIWSNKVANNWKEDELYHYIFIYKWNSKPSMIEETTCSTKYGFSLAKYCNYLLEKRYDDFFNILTEILFNVIKINTKKRKTAILFGTINLLEKFNDDLSSYINDEYKDENIKIGIFNGKVNKDDKLKILNDSDIILTTDKSFSKGMDAPNLEVVVNTVPFSSEVKLEQTVGRLRPLKDKKVIFLDINDTGFKGITY
jgi:superfamily II DNA or RNA helicase